jgi:hypothetical protein
MNYAYAAKEDGPYFEDEQDALDILKDDNEPGATVNIWKGIKRELHHQNFIRFDADDIIERMQESAFDECGEWAEDYLQSVPADKCKALEAHLTAAATEWFNANIDQPTFWIVDNPKAREITL